MCSREAGLVEVQGGMVPARARVLVRAAGGNRHVRETFWGGVDRRREIDAAERGVNCRREVREEGEGMK